MTRPTKPRWADGSADYVVEPPAGKKDTGWLSTEKPPFQYMNWIHKMGKDWIDWFEANWWSKQNLTLYSASPVTWNGTQIILNANLDMYLRYEAGARRTNRIAAGTLAIADGQCLVARFDYTNPTPAVLSSVANYADLAANKYWIGNESSLTLTNEEYERIIFRRRGTLLEVVPLGLLIPSPGYINLGSGPTGPEARHGGAVQTTDATVTDIVSIPIAEGEHVIAEALVVGRKSDGTARDAFKVIVSAYRNAEGNVTLNGASAPLFAEPGTWTAEFAADTVNQTLDLRVTGAAGTTINWTATVTLLKTT